jgi:hypothetical protein
MKARTGVVFLVVICVGMVIALLAEKEHADKQQKENAYAISDFSNQLASANLNLDGLRQVNLILTNDPPLRSKPPRTKSPTSSPKIRPWTSRW